MNIRSRLALLFSLAVFVTVALYSGGIYYFYRKDAYADLDKRLRDDVEVAEMALEKYVSENPRDESFTSAGFSLETDTSNWLTEIWDTKGERLYTSGASDASPLGAPDLDCTYTPKSYETTDASRTRVLCASSEAHPGAYRIRVARLTDKTAGLLEKFLFFMLLGIPLVVIISALTGYFLALKALSPISGIVDQARRISGENLSERLTVKNPKDELGQLTLAFNRMFGRLEDSFNQMRRFTADAAHELRTPLAALRTIGEVALRAERDPKEYREIIGDMLEESGRLQKLCESLLALSKAENGGLDLKKQKLELNGVLQDLLDLTGVLAEDKGVSISLTAPEGLEANIDPIWFRQALLNVLENAIKYAPPVSGQIAVSAERTLKGSSIRVRDNGPGISAIHLERVFERFYRADTGRDRVVGGTGLGLAIAKSIVSGHEGEISIASEVGKGTEVIISLPNA